MSKKTARVTIPKKPDELVLLIALVLAKHLADGVNSPLTILNNVASFVSKAQTVDAKQKSTLQKRKDAEKETEDRDILLGLAKGQTSTTDGTMLFFVTAIRDLLLAKFRGQEQKLSDWGFIVDASPKAKAKKVS